MSTAAIPAMKHTTVDVSSLCIGLFVVIGRGIHVLSEEREIYFTSVHFKSPMLCV